MGACRGVSGIAAEVIGAGVDVVSHSCLLAYQASAEMPRAYHKRAPIDAAKFADGIDPSATLLFAEMKARGTILDATNYVYEVIEMANVGNAGRTSVLLQRRHRREDHRGCLSCGSRCFSGHRFTGAVERALPRVPRRGRHHGAHRHRAGCDPALGHRGGAREPSGGPTRWARSRRGNSPIWSFSRVTRLADIKALHGVVLVVKRGRLYRRSDYVPVTEDEVRDVE